MILNSRYKNDPWLYDLDWSTKPYKTKIVTQKRKKGETTVKIYSYHHRNLLEILRNLKNVMIFLFFILSIETIQIIIENLF